MMQKNTTKILYTQSVLLILQRDFFIETELKLIL